MAGDVPARRSPLDAMMAAQEAAAARFEEQTGRKSTDPGPIGQAVNLYVNGRMLSVTWGYDQPDDPDQVDHYARHGMARVHVNRDGRIVRGAEAFTAEQRESIALRVQAGTAPLVALRELVAGVGGVEALTAAINADVEARQRRAEAIEVDVWDTEKLRAHRESEDTRWRREYMQEPPVRQERCPFVDEDGERCTEFEHGMRWAGDPGHRFDGQPTWTVMR